CHSDDTATPEAFTCHKLEALGKVALRYTAEECLRFQTFEEFMDSCIEKRFLHESDRPWFGADGWGRPMSWHAEKAGPVGVVRISSAGPDGVLGKSSGDDIVLEITFAEDGGSQRRLLKPR